MDIKLTDPQKYWYVRKEKTQGFDMKSEYPSFLLEAFEGQTEGTVYLNELNKMIKDGRYCNFGYAEGIPVYTIWDLGWADTMAVIFVQNVMGQLKIIDYYENSRQPYHHYAKVLQDKPYVYGGHFLPHDASHHNLLNGKSALDNIKNLGLRNVRQIERKSIEEGIREVRKIFSTIWISKQANIFIKNENGIMEKINFYDRLNNYRYEWNEKLNEYSKEPIHDVNSHGADTLRGLSACINKISNTFIKANNVNRGFGGLRPLDEKRGIY